jgi:hypothetical protein
MKFVDADHPFFRPLWRRVAVVAVCLVWALVEFLGGAPFWGILFGALGLWAGYEFFLAPRADRGAGPEERE